MKSCWQVSEIKNFFQWTFESKVTVYCSLYLLPGAHPTHSNLGRAGGSPQPEDRGHPTHPRKEPTLRAGGTPQAVGGGQLKTTSIHKKLTSSWILTTASLTKTWTLLHWGPMKILSTIRTHFSKSSLTPSRDAGSKSSRVALSTNLTFQTSPPFVTQDFTLGYMQGAESSTRTCSSPSSTTGYFRGEAPPLGPSRSDLRTLTPIFFLLCTT